MFRAGPCYFILYLGVNPGHGWIAFETRDDAFMSALLDTGKFTGAGGIGD